MGREGVRLTSITDGCVNDTREYDWLGSAPFLAAHLACLGVIWTGLEIVDLLLFVGLYLIRMFGITAGYHRYFSHRSFKTSRVAAFCFAVLAQSAAQRGVLWWVSAHRQHHRSADKADDPHSPARSGFWFSHIGWFLTKSHSGTDHTKIRDLVKYPELLWLNRYHYVPSVTLAILVLALFGWSGLIVGFFWSTVALWHATFAINSVGHMLGQQRFSTGDESRNNWVLALLTLGEGWHNNHHRFQSSSRQGYYWYEFDPTYWGIWVLSKAGLVWDVRLPRAFSAAPVKSS